MSKEAGKIDQTGMKVERKWTNPELEKLFLKYEKLCDEIAQRYKDRMKPKPNSNATMLLNPPNPRKLWMEMNSELEPIRKIMADLVSLGTTTYYLTSSDFSRQTPHTDGNSKS